MGSDPPPVDDNSYEADALPTKQQRLDDYSFAFLAKFSWTLRTRYVFCTEPDPGVMIGTTLSPSIII